MAAGTENAPLLTGTIPPQTALWMSCYACERGRFRVAWIITPAGDEAACAADGQVPGTPRYMLSCEECGANSWLIAGGPPRGTWQPDAWLREQLEGETPMPDLKERVAALEAALAFACTSPPPRPLTEAEMAALAEQLAEAVRLGPLSHFLPSVPPLTPEQVRYLLRECVTAVRPGETLVIRDRNWNPEQVREIQQWMDAEHDSGRISFKVLAVIGEELTVAEPGGIPGAA